MINWNCPDNETRSVGRSVLNVIWNLPSVRSVATNIPRDLMCAYRSCVSSLPYGISSWATKSILLSSKNSSVSSHGASVRIWIIKEKNKNKTIEMVSFASKIQSNRDKQLNWLALNSPRQHSDNVSQLRIALFQSWRYAPCDCASVHRCTRQQSNTHSEIHFWPGDDRQMWSD